jgi:putative spermidine/putrescine transport system substrate-binding protein
MLRPRLLIANVQKEETDMKKIRPFALALSTYVAAFGFAATASGQDRPTMYLAGYGGSFEQMMKTVVIPPFEQANNVKVEYVVGTTAQTLAKLQAQKSAQEIDAAILDWGAMLVADEMSVCVSVKPNPAIDRAIDRAKPLGDKAMGIYVDAEGPIYNEEMFTKLKMPAPTSWADFAKEDYRDQISLAHVSTVTGVDGLVMVARALGGGENNIDPAFEAFSGPIRANVVTFSPSAPKIEELLQRQEIALTSLTRSRVLSLQKRGLPIKIANTKEGPVAILNMVCPIVQSDVPDLAQKFVYHMLSDKVQIELARSGFIPVLKDLTVPADVLAANPLNPDDLARMNWLDWPTINRNRADWINRWNREVER